jgi:hypothetical protein
MLEGLAQGREKAIARMRERAAITETLARRLYDIDLLAGHPPRGRAGRLSRAMRREGVSITERGVRKILERLSSSSDSLRSNAQQSIPESPEPP